MKRLNLHFFIIMLFVMSALKVNAQKQTDEFVPNGKFQGTLYANFNTSLVSSEPTTSFEVSRAYLGYSYNFTSNITMALKLDIGSPDEISNDKQLRRYAYFKTAAGFYTVKNFKIGFGMIDTHQFGVQNKFWTRRYLAQNIAEGNGMGPSADLGVSVAAKWDKIEADFGIFNGEGYQEVQVDEAFKVSGGVTYKPIDCWVFRLYGDMMKKEGVSQNTYTAFAGYKHSLFTLGGEWVMKQNEKYISGNNRQGFSTYGSVNLTEKIQLWGRYDYLVSSVPDGDIIPWNLEDDGSAIIAGVEYKVMSNIKVALSYHDWMPWAENMDIESTIYLNLEMKF